MLSKMELQRGRVENVENDRWRLEVRNFLKIKKKIKLKKKWREMESEEYEFEDSFGGVFSTEMFETNLRIEGEMRGKEYSKIYFYIRSTTFLSDINTFSFYTAEEDAAKPPTCSICFEELSNLARGKLDSCDHLYWYVSCIPRLRTLDNSLTLTRSFECITEWSSRENTCPCCKKRFKRIEKVDEKGQVKDKVVRAMKENTT